MKEISEENQWKIFELLEGNLTESEAQDLKKAIEQDADLNRYYLSLKQTYLEPSPIVFPRKNKLLKSAFFKVIYPTYFKYAAAAILIGAVSYLQLFRKSDSITVNRVPQISSTVIPNSNAKNQTYQTHKSESLSLSIPYSKLSLNKRVKRNRRTNIKGLKTFEERKFNPSTKLIEENQFLNQLIDNQYLSNNEKKDIMLKWLLMNSSNPQTQNEQKATASIPVQVNVIQQEILSPVELESIELNEIWVKEAKQMLKQGKIPKLKLVKSKQERKWLPKFDLEIQTETASMIQNIIE
jgi:uncharacterized protein with FMN-binding domain